jgi:hypothetical protein
LLLVQSVILYPSVVVLSCPLLSCARVRFSFRSAFVC